MTRTRGHICTLLLALGIAALVTPAFQSLITPAAHSMSAPSSRLFAAIIYVIQGSASLTGARVVSRWIFA